MKLMPSLFGIVLTFFVTVSESQQYRMEPNRFQSPIYRLHSYLMRDYRRNVRPVLSPTKVIEIGVYTYLYQIIEVEQKTNTILVSACLELFWSDDFLRWNPESFSNTTEIFLPSKKIWTPEISAYYSVASNRMLENNNDLRVNSTGHVRYFMPFAVKNLCHIDVKYFPFDWQICKLYFGPWAYSLAEMDFKLLADTVDTSDFFDNQEWLLKETNITRTVLTYEYLGLHVNYSCIVMQLRLSRQSFYYVFNLVAPTCLIAVVSVIGFHMPGSSSQMRDAKFRLGIMTILSMTMLLLAIVDDMPKFALRRDAEAKRGSFSSVPLIGLYYFSLLAIIGLGTVTSSMFVSLERKVRRKEVPWYLRWMAWDRIPFGSSRQRREEALDMIVTNDNAETTAKKISQYRHLLITPCCSPRQTICSERRITSPPKTTFNTDTLGYCRNSKLSKFTYLQTATNELLDALASIERSVIGIRYELYSFMPKNTIQDQWLIIINRLETLSLIIYLSAIGVILLMFFYPSWY